MRDEDLARHSFHEVGAYDGPTIFPCNVYANGIRNRGYRPTPVVVPREDRPSV
jgi:hypothetical protein